MKIDRSKVKKSTSEVPAECKVLIDKIKACGSNRDALVPELKQIKSWTFGKCELFHWADVLDMFDDVLETSCRKEHDRQWVLPLDVHENGSLKQLVLQVLQFTALLIEHSFTRHLYNSMEHLTTLLSSSDMTVVLGVLNLLYVFSKRSTFITRLNNEKKEQLVVRLTHLAESWGGKENGFGLAECCQDLDMNSFPSSATTLHFEFYADRKDERSIRKTQTVLSTIHVENVDKLPKLAAQIMEDLMSQYYVPSDKQMLLMTHIRLAQGFSQYDKRIQCVQARLQAISCLVYSNAIQDNVNSVLYSGFIEELVDILQVRDDNLIEIKAAALRTLTSVTHLDRNPKLQSIIDATEAASYHGFLPTLVRNCIQHMTDEKLEPFPQPFATALFSFLYHLASYECGGEALVSCGMMESLLKVINWQSEGQEHITFVTRAVRVVDLITNLGMQSFQTQAGLNAFINRLQHEVDLCRREQPFVIRPIGQSDSSFTMDASSPGSHITDHASAEYDHPMPMETDVNQGASTSTAPPPALDKPKEGKGLQCFPQRAALLKSMLNFLKKAIPDPAFANTNRHLMDGSLPRSLKHIISNAEYYGPSLFLLATDVVTVYVFQEPSLLSSLQDNGLTDVVLHALLVKDVPATRELLAALPNVFSALCLNTRGLDAFVQCKPFDRLFKVLLSPDYLPAMRRRRSSDPPGDTASNLGSAMDELMRHQPSLRSEATKAIILLLEEVCTMGRDPKYMCQKPLPKNEQAGGLSTTSSLRSQLNNDGAGSSEDEDEDDEDTAANAGASDAGKSAANNAQQPTTTAQTSQERMPIPLMDYVLNVMKFVEAILSNNTTDDHCREFVTQKGLIPLMGILGLPNLPIDFPSTPSCQAVAMVCKSILTLSHEPQILKQGLLHLNEVLERLEPLHKFVEPPGGSVLLEELARAHGITDPTLSATATPLLHSLSAAHAYIAMFTHVCKVGQSDMRSMSVSHWGSELGLQVLGGLSRLYTSLVWESTVLLAFCNEDVLPPGCEFGKAHLEKILPKDLKEKLVKTDQSDIHPNLTKSHGPELGSNGVSHAMETLSTSDTNATASPMDTDDNAHIGQTISCTSISCKPDSGAREFSIICKKSKLSPLLQAQIKQIKPLLSASSRLGRALAELFGLLVKLCVGSPVRQRRTQIPVTPAVPTPAAKAVAGALTKLLISGLQWTPPECSPVPKLRLTFYICSVGFTSPMLFDEKKMPYHLMLQRFLNSGGQEALFEAFRWALSSGGKFPIGNGFESNVLPEGTGEFLDAWLMLLEKMVNVKNVLDSPHVLPTKAPSIHPQTFTPFNVVQYLIRAHKMAFEAVMYLWNKKPLKGYGARMTDSILAILCHIIKGESIIRERLEKQRAEDLKTKPIVSQANTVPQSGQSTQTTANASASAPQPTSAAAVAAAAAYLPPDPPAVVPEHLQQLMDMGFSREHAVEALTQTSSVEAATEYCLTHPPPLTPPAQNVAMRGNDLQQRHAALFDEQSLRRAIDMSLGETVSVNNDQPGSSATKEEEKKPPTPDSEEKALAEEEPLEKSVLDKFTDEMLSGCMQLLDALPESVYRICDLLVVVAHRNGEKWREDVLSSLVGEIAELCLCLMEAASPMTSADLRTVTEWAADLVNKEEASKLATRLHVLSLLFEEMKMACAECVEDSGLLDLLVGLLDKTQQCMSAAGVNKESSTPKWVAPLLILLDLYEKIAVASKRKATLEKIVGKKHVWKWFEDRSGRWCTYSDGNNKTIDDAYMAGETSIRFTAGRRRYTVQFHSMVQVNEETGNRRPIMLSIPSKEEEGKANKDAQNNATAASASNGKPEEKAEESNMETDSPSDECSELRVVQGLNIEHIGTIINCSVSLISIPVDSDTIHAVLRLVLRLTRDHRFAIQFAELGGPRLLLGLTQASSFQGYTSLATLIFRHILEEPSTLKHTLEKVIRSATAGTGSSMSGVAQNTMGSKELHYVLRVLGPAACRCPELFTEVANECLTITLPPPAKRDEEEARLTLPTTPQLVKCHPTKQAANPVPHSTVKVMLEQLLEALIVKYVPPVEEKLCQVDKAGTVSMLAEAIQEVARDLTGRAGMIRQDSSAELNVQETESDDLARARAVDRVLGAEEESQQDTPEGEAKTDDVKEKKNKEEEEKNKRPLLPKSAILRLLAEMVKSYSVCAQLVTQHTYATGQSEMITEDTPALAFILDFLLPSCQEAGDKDCGPLSRVLISTIASCNHSPDAQSTLVGEIKAALQRALALTESKEKHAKIQALTSIISSVIESCPTPGQPLSTVFKSQNVGMNNVVKILLKKGLVTDLARIPHSLDLSSPNMATTINGALKPLEVLSQIVNQPQPVIPTKSGKKNNTGETQQSTTEPLVQEANEQNTDNAERERQAEEGGDDAEGRTRENNVTIEDVTDSQQNHDDLEETGPEAVCPPQSQVSDSEDENELQDVIDTLLRRDRSNRSRSNEDESVVADIIMDGSNNRAEDEANLMVNLMVDNMSAMMDDSAHHDSQMITQEISDDEGEDNTQVDERDEHFSINQEGEYDDNDDDDNDDDNEDDDNDDDEDDEDDEDEDDEDDDEGSDMERDDEYEGMDDAFHQIGDDDLYAQLEEMLPPGGQVLFGDLYHPRTSDFPMGFSDPLADTMNDFSSSTIPPAPSTVTPTHPLLVRHAESHTIGSNSLAARVHRAGGRQRGTYRFNPNTQTLHLTYGSRRDNPALLQRLLGPSTAADVIQLTSAISTGGQSRLHFITNDASNMRFLNNIEDDPFEEYFPDALFDSDGRGGSSDVVSGVPSALSRWTEEARVLDSDSVHDAMTVLKPEIIAALEKERDKELAERKEKRKKTAEEEAAKKAKEGKEDNKDDHDKTIEWSGPPSCTAETASTETSSNTLTARNDPHNTPGEEDIEHSSSGAEPQRNHESLAEAIATAIIGETNVRSTPPVTLSNQLSETPATSGFQPMPMASSLAMETPAPTARPSMAPGAPARSNIVPMASPLSITPLAPSTTSSFHPFPQSSGPSQASPMDMTEDVASIPLPLEPDPHPPPPPPSQAWQAEGDQQEPPITTYEQIFGTALARLSSQPESSHQGDDQQPITPEQPSDITSSDAVTINSSTSNSETPSMAEGGAADLPPAQELQNSLAGVLAAASIVDTIGTSSGVATAAPPSVPATATPSEGSTSSTQPQAGSSAGSAFGDITLPEGVDPSFLAALPENIRQEVIEEQRRLQQLQQRAQEQQQQAAQLGGVGEVSPEFLAALPPSIQEEVLAQQRAEQARVAAETIAPAAAPPDQSVDPAGFIQSLPPSLRQQVLADMDDSMVAVLPADLAAEANMLRRELEERHSRLMQERLLTQGGGPLSTLLQSGLGRLSSTRYSVRQPTTRRHHWTLGGRHQGVSGLGAAANSVRLRGRHLLDHEALTCLLVLLFVDEPKLNTTRLYRVLRNLCYHSPTRVWVIRALLSVLQRTGDCRLSEGTAAANASAICDTSRTPTASSTPSSTTKTGAKKSSSQGFVGGGSPATSQQEILQTPSRPPVDAMRPSWLSISLDAALGCRANVFQMQRGHSSKKTPANTAVNIHPQAAPVVCRNVLDTLISLAKSFPSQFLPQTNKVKEAASCSNVATDSDMDKNKDKGTGKTPSDNAKVDTLAKSVDMDFWEILVRLDGVSSGKKGKSLHHHQRQHSNSGETTSESGTNTVQSFDSSPLGQLMSMLSHPVLRRSQLLTDRLLRLLGLVSMGLQEVTNPTSATPRAGPNVSTGATVAVVPSGAANVMATSASAPVPSASNNGLSVSSTVQISTTSTPSVATEETPAPAAVDRTISDSRVADETLALSETMEISTVPDEHLTSTPLPTKKEEDVDKTPTSENPAVVEVEEAPVLQPQLQLAVQVLTSKSCSEEGLEDATNLLVQLSRANNATRDAVLALLLVGATEIGMTVCDHIRKLLDELMSLNASLDQQDSPTKENQDTEMSSGSSDQKGVLSDRFGGGAIVVHAPKNVKPAAGRELQLPSMIQLTAKTSSQQFLLRILKVIIQLREAAKQAAKKNRKIEPRDFSNISEAMAILEAEAETIMELVGRRDRLASSLGANIPTSSAAGAMARPIVSTAASSQNNATAAAVVRDPNPPATVPQADRISTPPADADMNPPDQPDEPPANIPNAQHPMEVDNPPSTSGANQGKQGEEELVLPRLSEQLQLESLWQALGECLSQLAKTTDQHAVLVLQPAVEAFFMVHAGEKEEKVSNQRTRTGGNSDQLDHLNYDLTGPMSPAGPSTSEGASNALGRQDSMVNSTYGNSLPPDTTKFLAFAETHRTVLNQILRQSTTPLADGPFSVLVDHTRILDFDVKRRYFRKELERLDGGIRREDLAVHVRREHIFEDSFRDIHRRSADEWKHRFYIVFEGEEGQDAGGLLREWYLIMSREIFNPNYALFMISPGDRVTYTINPSSHCNSNHLSYFKFVGRFLAKAVFDNKLLECYFTRSFYKHILGKQVKYTDMESEDYAFYQGLVFLMEHDVNDLGYDLSFSTEIQEFGKTEIRDLKPNGRNIPVTEENKKEYIKLVCVEKMTGAIRKQLNAFLEGFYDIIPKHLISIFNEQELELLISGLPTIDIDELKANTEYHKYQATSLQIQWFWRALRSFEQADRAAFLQFVTGTSKVPLQGFAFLEGMNGIQKFQIHRDDRSTDRLPCAHTCFNQLDLPAYETYDKLRKMLLIAVHECSEGFGLA